MGVTNQLDRYRLAIDALRLSLARHSVTLLVWQRANGKPATASATCVHLGGVRCLMTAAHVVKNAAPAEIAVVFTGQPKPDNAFVESIRFVGGDEGDPLDIALLVLKSSGADQIAECKEFVSEDRRLPNISAAQDRLFVVYGTPGVWSPMSEETKRFAAVPMCYATLSCSPFPSTCSEQNDIALEYPKATNITTLQPGEVEAPNPEGVSGGGIWLAAEPARGAFWNPQDSKLVGVQRGWYKKSEWLRGTQIQHGTALLASAAPSGRR